MILIIYWLLSEQCTLNCCFFYFYISVIESKFTNLMLIIHSGNFSKFDGTNSWSDHHTFGLRKPSVSVKTHPYKNNRVES